MMYSQYNVEPKNKYLLMNALKSLIIIGLLALPMRVDHRRSSVVPSIRPSVRAYTVFLFIESPKSLVGLFLKIVSTRELVSIFYVDYKYGLSS